MPAFGLDHATLWEYLGHPDDEPPERRRVLYAIVALRLGLGLMFLLHGWDAVFGPTLEGFAARLGDPGRWGLGNETTRDLVLFLVGCTELMVGVFLVVGVFSRVSAVTGGVLLLLSIAVGYDTTADFCRETHAFCDVTLYYRDFVATGASLTALGGLLLIILCGSPYLSADRFLDKIEEEERDRLPAVLPRLATRTPLLPRLGLAAGLVWAGLFSTMSLHNFASLQGMIERAARGSLPSLPIEVVPLAAILLAPLLVAGLATRVCGPLGAALLALVTSVVLPGAGAWLLLGPLAVGVALAITGGGRLSLDHRRRLRRTAAAGPPAPAEGTGAALTHH